MPELADVERFRRIWARHVTGARVAHVRAPAPVLIRNSSPQGLGRALQGRAFDTPRRHGKWLLAPIEKHLLAVHFGMTGDLHWTSRDEADGAYDGVVFETDRGTLRYRSQRRLGGIWLVREGSPLTRVTGELGPDAAAMRWDELRARFADRRGGIKAALMDQSLLAGLGNELSDEILWRARIHPATAVCGLSERRLRALYDGMREVLRASMRHGRIPARAGWLESVREEREAGCPRCGASLARGRVAGRTALWCPRCQPERD
jgi:formamidopyrimidine-DNA glycosylase